LRNDEVISSDGGPRVGGLSALSSARRAFNRQRCCQICPLIFLAAARIDRTWAGSRRDDMKVAGEQTCLSALPFRGACQVMSPQLINDRIIWNVVAAASIFFGYGVLFVNAIQKSMEGDLTFITLFTLIFALCIFGMVVNTRLVLREL
jgi:hypothetical protein